MVEKREIFICRSTGCNSLDAGGIHQELEDQIKANNLEKLVSVKATGCHGFCQTGPRLIIYPEGVMYIRLKKSDVKDIIEQHIKKNEPVERILYKDPVTGKPVRYKADVKFFNSQLNITTHNCGEIDPEVIDEYIAKGGYKSLKKALKMKPADIIDSIKKAKLRGRGGAGFSTAFKWQAIANEKATPKYLICNGDEGDPGAFMDRTILESDPNAVLEGMIIGAYAVGASQGFIYARAEYPLAIKRVTIAIKQAREKGFLGKNILGSGLDFDIQLRKGAGAFVCGEETALMSSIMGMRGNPRPRPPFPANSGLWGKPTNINNVKTWATIPRILDIGPENYAKIGTPDSSGTAILCITGKINNAGLVEIPMGTTIRKLVYDIGGGCPNNKKFKAIQTGGPSGGCIPAQFLDTPIDYEHLTALGAIMGSGGLIVLDEDTCMVELAHFFITFTQNESCGKCSPCALGTRKMLQILTKIRDGKGMMEDLDQLESLAQTVKKSSLCGLGQTAPNPVITTLKYFKDEYIAHIKGSCPALVCKNLIEYKIDEEKCTGCSLCSRSCASNAITGELKKKFKIDPTKCVKCGLCFSTCNFKAIYKTTGGN